MFDNPADTYRVFGELAPGVRSLWQVLDQLADAHLSHQGRAFDDHGDHTAGAADALAAANELHQQAGTPLVRASSLSRLTESNRRPTHYECVALTD